jgi:hypothetical protein
MKPLFRLCLASVCAALSILPGCAGKQPPPPPEPPAEVRVDVPARPEALPEVLLHVPQRVAEAVPLSDDPLLGPEEQAALHERALERFFAPWTLTRTSIPSQEAFWGTAAYGSKQGYAENLQPYPRERWEQLVAQQNMAAYPSMAAPAIVTRNTALRILPSHRPFFLDPSLPGEGFPFDYFQNSALWLGTPVFISHTSLDHAWLFVETAFTSGWMRAEDLALADEAFRGKYRSRIMAAVLADDTSLLGGGKYLGQAHIGAVFPLHSRTGQGLVVKVPLRDASGMAQTGLAHLAPWQAALMPLPLTSRAVGSLADAMAGQLYGWGGLYENRDCSSTLRDLFLPFGIWLPRNSSQQARQGDHLVDLEGLDADRKLATIRGLGKPFLSRIWMPGHIGLFLGTDPRGEPLLLHNIWGVRTVLPDGGTGRAVIGRLAISTLRPGEDLPDVRRGAFLDRIRGMAVLGAGTSTGTPLQPVK